MSKIFAISYPAKMVPTHCDKISWQNFGFSSSIKLKKDALIFWILSMLSHSLTKTNNYVRLLYVCDFLQLIRSDFPLNSV